ncbi:MAG: polyprenyl synthetase family protein [Acidiferrobacterales bacterium]|nr:polyprenyl synthetase family protein [Acidiferrobacterales bacterium]
MNNTLKEYQARVENVLEQALSTDHNGDIPERLLKAMRYSTLEGGKRVRALLAYASGAAVNAPLDQLDQVAAALECIHSYSLIHDDLPAMDDDDLRRGKATNHKEFDEATAILAGDALLTFAFELVNADQSSLSDQQSRQLSVLLSQCAGANGMVGGQMLDILATQRDLNQSELERIHRGKTGALIRAAVLGGAFCGEYSDNTLEKLTVYANNIGLAFQVVDDILDIEGSTEELGKTSGADESLGKSTYPSILGLANSKSFAQKLYQEAIASIDSISDNTELLVELAKLVVNRKK